VTNLSSAMWFTAESLQSMKATVTKESIPALPAAGSITPTTGSNVGPPMEYRGESIH
jgi:hypothetical protein